MGKTVASVTIYVDVFDAQAMWAAALKKYEEGQAMRADFMEMKLEFVDMCGTEEEPDICECLRMIFDPGESPPGIQINDSSAEVEAPF